MKKALITGITGQDGAYLAKFLLEKGYKIVGIIRTSLNVNYFRLNYLGIINQIEFHELNLENLTEVINCIEVHHPTEIYNLAAQSSVGESFNHPEKTFSFNTLSVINLLEAIRQVNRVIKFYQASSSEMFGNVDLKNLPVSESLVFHPVSPYGISKASSHWLSVNYREAFGIYSACGILFNHESTLRPDNFVFKKIISTALRIKDGSSEDLVLGNLAISRDWGYAPEYVKAMWLILQQERANDFVICSGRVSTLLDIVKNVFEYLDIDMKKHVRLDPKLIRLLDLNIIYGTNERAKSQLGWNYEMDNIELISRLIEDEKELINWKKTNLKL